MEMRFKFLTATVVVSLLAGCSPQALKRTGYETLHNVSDIQNDGDPKYDPGQRSSFETYQQQREETLRGKPQDSGAPIVPDPPVKP